MDQHSQFTPKRIVNGLVEYYSLDNFAELGEVESEELNSISF